MLENSCALLWADLIYGELIKVLTWAYGRQQKHNIATYTACMPVESAQC